MWENTNNEQVLNEARAEILKATDGHPPPVLDPFCGGGSIPLEAQRLGLEAHASDLNPVAVLITKALIEIPPKFAGMPPVNPEARKEMQKKIQGQDWPGATGLADDVRYYGKWIRDEAEKRIGHLYSKAKLPDGSEATVIAWLWARTVKCPNPACGAMMPLVSKFELSTKKGKEAWVEPIVNSNQDIRFEVRTGQGQPRDGTVNRRGARCIACGTPVGFDHIRAEGKAVGMGAQLMAIVAKGLRGRFYITPDSGHAALAEKIQPAWRPESELPHNPRDFKTPNYGMRSFGDLFTPRQLVALTTFSDLVAEAREHALADARAAGLAEGKGIAENGHGARAYADAVATYLGFGLSKLTDYNSTLVSWSQSRDQAAHTFTKQALPMVWDFAEVNPLAGAAGDLSVSLNGISEMLQKGFSNSRTSKGSSSQIDSTSTSRYQGLHIISTDPPYYDNVSYGDISNFFYIWLRRSIRSVYPDLFSTLLVPIANELVATPYRFGGNKEKARLFFEKGLGGTFQNLKLTADPDYPATIYYAFKQIEKYEEKGNAKPSTAAISSTGWETMLESLLNSKFVITGTWPMRTERISRSISLGTNALASSIVLVCRPRPDEAPIGTRKEFLAALKRELPEALRQLQKGNIAPVDLAQAAIGPGMAIFSRYSKVLEADGSSMRVRIALQLINQHLDGYLSEQEGEYDPDTRWALSWFEQYGMNEGPFGDAETLSKAKNTSVQGMVDAGILKAGAGKARLLKREEMDASWNPNTDKRLTVWEAAQHLIRVLEAEGETGAADLQQRLGGLAQSARDLAYRLYSICERQGWSQEALAYNSLVTTWPRLQELAVETMRKGGQQTFEV